MSERRILKNILSLSFAEFANRGVSFFITLYLARVISVEGYGALAYVNSIMSYLLMVISMGMYVIGLRESARDKSNIQQYYSNITTIKLILAGACCLGIGFFVYITEVSYIVKASLLVGCIQLFAFAIVADWVFLSQEKMHIIAVRQVLINIMSLIGVVLFVHSVADIPIYILVVSVATLLSHLWLLRMGIKHFFKFKLAFDFELIKTILKQAVPLSLSYFLITIMAQFGTTYLTSEHGYHKAGLFSSAIKIATFAVIPTSIIQGAFAPRISKCVGIEDRQNIAKKYTTNLLAMGAIVSAMIYFFPEFFIYVCFGESFANAAMLLKIVSVYIMFYYISNVTITFFFFWGLEKRLLIAYATATAVYIVATILLVNAYADWGAVVAMLFGDGTLAAILVILLKQVVNKVYIKVSMPLLLVATLACFCGQMLNSLWYDTLYLHIIGIIVAMLLYSTIALKLKIVSWTEIKTAIKK